MLRLLKLIVLFAAFVLTLAFTLLNRESSVTLNYYYGELAVSLPLLVIGLLALGWLLGLLSLSGRILRMTGRNAKLQREVRQAETEVQNLRKLPLQNDY